MAILRARQRAAPWAIYLFLGLVATGVYFALPSTLAQNLAYAGIGFSAVIVMLVGVRLHRPARPLPWYLLALGDGLAVVGDLIWTYDENVRGIEVPFPSVADALYLGGYAVFFVGMLLLIRGITAGRDRSGLIDTAILTIGGGVIAWVFLIDPLVHDATQPLLERFVASAYPAVDVLMLMSAVRLALGLERRTTALQLLILALWCSLATDLVYAILTAQGQYQTGHPIDSGWLLAYLLHGAVALHPSMRERPVLAPEREVALPRGRLALLAVAALIGPALLTFQSLRGAHIDVPVIVAASATLFLLALVRLHLLAEALRGREARFRALVQRATDGVAIADATGVVRYQSPAVAAIIGYSPEDLIGTDIFARLHEEDAATARQLFASLLGEPGGTRTVQVRLRHADDAWRVLEVGGTNLLDEPGVGGIVLNYRDVTERTLAEATRRASEERLQAQYDGFPLPTFTWRRDGDDFVLIGHNAAATGPLASQVGVRCREFNRDRPEVVADFARCYAERTTLRREYTFRAGSTDERRHIAATYVFVPPDLLMIHTEDITERWRAEVNLRQAAESFGDMFDAAGEGLIFRDGETILAVNQTFATLVGRPVAEFVGGSVAELFTAETRERAWEEARQSADHPFEAAIGRADGTAIPVEVSGQAIRYQGRPVHLVALRDISERKAADTALRESEARFRLLAENAQDTVFRYRFLPTRGFDYVSPAATALGGYTPEEHYADPDILLRIAHPDDREAFLAGFARGGQGGASLLRWLRKDGTVIWTEQRATPIRDDDGRIVAIEGIVRDVSARVAADAALRASAEQLAAAQAIAHLGSWESDIATEALRWSDEVFRIMGYPPQSFAPTLERLMAAIHPGDRARVQRARLTSLEGVPYDLDHRIVRPDGEVRVVHQQAEIIRDGEGHPVKRVGIIQDITERRALEERLAHQATHDALTALPNRALFLDRADQALARARRGGPPCAVLFLDLDNFKTVNDTLGHDAGDQLLMAATGRLRHCLRDEDTLARLGGDEFTVLLENAANAGEAMWIAGRLGEALAEPFRLDGGEFRVTASIGIVFATGAYARAEDLLRDADIAMYRAKESGKARCAIFDPAMQADVLARLALERDLRGALERDEFALHYQPQIALATGRVVGVEALARWQHPERGLMPPGGFIPLAEEVGLIRPLGRWALRTACRQVADWNRRRAALGESPLTVGVNLSAREFAQPHLREQVAEALAEADLEPGCLQIEITETTMVEDFAAAAHVLRGLKGLGVRLALDDFGTGYSSLSYLQGLPLDVLKIDKAFVADLGRGAEGEAIVGAVIALGHALGLTLTAEGVESSAQAARLRSLGCEVGQGYHFARPLPPEEAEAQFAPEIVRRAALVASAE